MTKHYLSDQARGLAMAARSEDEKNHILQMANELDSMWTMCNSQAQAVKIMQADLDKSRKQHAEEVRVNSALREQIEDAYREKMKEFRTKYLSGIKTVDDLLTIADTRSTKVLQRLSRKNDTLESLHERFQKVDITNFPNAGQVTKRNIQKLFEEIRVASS